MRRVLLAAAGLSAFVTARAEDTRQFVKFPPMMLEHEMANMRDHLATLGKVTGRCVACHAAYRLH